MVATFLIVLREAFEAALLLGIVYTYLLKLDRRSHFRYVTAGAALGVLASILVGVAVSFASGPLLDLGPDLVATIVVFVAVLVLTWMMVWMRQHARGMSGAVRRRVDEAEGTRQLWIIGLVAFTGVFREGAETVLFVWGLLSQATAGAGWTSLVGAVLGVVLAGLLAWGIFNGGKALSLQTFFTVTSALLLFVAAGLFSSGVGRLQGLGFLPGSGPLWDTSWLLGDGGLLGSFLNGLVGYRARPSSFEVASYLGYLVVAASLLFREVPSRLLARPRALLGRSAH